MGLFIGCIFSGVLVDKLGRFCDLFIAVCLDVAAIVTVIIPWASGIAVLWVCCTIGGVMETLINVCKWFFIESNVFICFISILISIKVKGQDKTIKHCVTIKA